MSGRSMPALKSPWLTSHVLTAVIAYGGFALAAALAAIHLKKASPENNEEWIYKIVAASFLMLTVTIGLGAVWAEQAWGRYWAGIPKNLGRLLPGLSTPDISTCAASSSGGERTQPAGSGRLHIRPLYLLRGQLPAFRPAQLQLVHHAQTIFIPQIRSACHKFQAPSALRMRNGMRSATATDSIVPRCHGWQGRGRRSWRT